MISLLRGAATGLRLLDFKFDNSHDLTSFSRTAFERRLLCFCCCLCFRLRNRARGNGLQIFVTNCATCHRSNSGTRAPLPEVLQQMPREAIYAH